MNMFIIYIVKFSIIYKRYSRLLSQNVKKIGKVYFWNFLGFFFWDPFRGNRELNEAINFFNKWSNEVGMPINFRKSGILKYNQEFKHKNRERHFSCEFIFSEYQNNIKI